MKKQLEVRIETINMLISAFGDKDGKLAKELNEVYGKLEKLKKQEEKKMKRMKAIIDTWNIIDKYNIQNWKQENDTIYIPKEEFDRVYEEILNKSYLINLIK